MKFLRSSPEDATDEQADGQIERRAREHQNQLDLRTVDANNE